MRGALDQARVDGPSSGPVSTAVSAMMNGLPVNFLISRMVGPKTPLNVWGPVSAK